MQTIRRIKTIETGKTTEHTLMVEAVTDKGYTREKHVPYVVATLFDGFDKIKVSLFNLKSRHFIPRIM